MPRITMTMLEGVIVQWHKKVGDPVKEGEVVVEVETDKVVQSLTAPMTGIISSLIAKEGDVVPVDKPFYTIAGEGETVASKVAAGASVPAPKVETVPVQSSKSAPAAASSAASDSGVVTVAMPQITMTMLEGVIVSWHKREGDSVKEGEPLVEIETDKVVQTLNASVTGVLLRLMAKEGDTVAVGKPICAIGPAGSRVVEPPADQTGATVAKLVSASSASAGQSMQKASSAASSSVHTVEKNITLPSLGSAQDCCFIKWLCPEGTVVKNGEPLALIEVNDAIRTLDAFAPGPVKRFIAHSGDTIAVGEPLYASEAASAGHFVSCDNVSPWAKRLAAERGIDLSALTGSGSGGLIVAADLPQSGTVSIPAVSTASAVSSFATSKETAAGAITSAPVSDDTVLPFNGIRRRIAENLMVTKHNAADVTTFAEVNMGRIKELRKNLPVSFTAFTLKAAAMALREFPILNSTLSEDKILVHNHINLNVAVATPRGLVTPVMRDADTMNFITIGEHLNDFAARGRDLKLTFADYEGGTFTVTNSGTYGALFFTPIINNGQSAIMGVGKIMMTPIVTSEGEIIAAPMMYLSLTYDHRVVDGETSVKFLQRVKHYLENPGEMTGLKGKK